MPLEILLAMVVMGIALLAAILHVAGRSKARILSEEDARSQWHRHFPDDLIRAVILSPDARSALILLEAGRGLLWSFGADTVGRHLMDFDLTETSKGLKINFQDFAAPRITIPLNQIERERWRCLMTDAQPPAKPQTGI